jgi:hypothetical protein
MGLSAAAVARTMKSDDVSTALHLISRLGLNLEDLAINPIDGRSVPTFRDYIPRVAAAVSASTARSYRTYWRIIESVWGERCLDEPTALEIEQLVNEHKDRALGRTEPGELQATALDGGTPAGSVHSRVSVGAAADEQQAADGTGKSQEAAAAGSGGEQSIGPGCGRTEHLGHNGVTVACSDQRAEGSDQFLTLARLFGFGPLAHGAAWPPQDFQRPSTRHI